MYPKDEAVEIVGYSYCGDYPGGNIEYVPEEMIRNGAEVIHLATGLVVGYPPFKYMAVHKKLSFWENMNMESLAGDLMGEFECYD